MNIMDVKEFETFILKRGCVKCKHQWFPRSAKPQRCPKCQTWLDKWDDENDEITNQDETQK